MCKEFIWQFFYSAKDTDIFGLLVRDSSRRTIFNNFEIPLEKKGSNVLVK